MPRPLPDDVRQALEAGQKLQAIALLRQHTGLGLAQAKAAVEAGLVPDAPALATNFAELPSEVSAAIASGSKVEAIRRLRQSRGIDLKEAKAIVERADQKARQQAGRQAQGLSPGEVPRTRMAPALVVALALLLAAAVWFLAAP